MVSPEMLRRYPFFAHLDGPRLRALAMLTDEYACKQGEKLFEVGQPADEMYLLVQGGIDLYYVVADRQDPSSRKEYFVGEVDPGELFGLSALIEPYLHTSMTVVNQDSLVLKIDAARLRALCEEDLPFAYTLMRHAAQTLMDRLQESRIQLAAARA